MQMPVLFTGHGNPMLALNDNDLVANLKQLGIHIRQNYGKPKAILALSAHWLTDGAYIQNARRPKQMYDIYGYPEELYQLRYRPYGSPELTTRVQQLLGSKLGIDNSWGIDHGIWTVLVHLFPQADIPVVQLSLDKNFTPAQCLELGQKLAPLRGEGYLLLGSGNIVCNRRRLERNKRKGSLAAQRFNNFIIEKVNDEDITSLLRYKENEDAAYAVPQPDHFYPLLFCLGAAGETKAQVYNNQCDLGSLSMTGFIWS